MIRAVRIKLLRGRCRQLVIKQLVMWATSNLLEQLIQPCDKTITTCSRLVNN
jgi:hypothetical protein